MPPSPPWPIPGASILAAALVAGSENNGRSGSGSFHLSPWPSRGNRFAAHAASPEYGPDSLKPPLIPARDCVLYQSQTRQLGTRPSNSVGQRTVAAEYNARFLIAETKMDDSKSQVDQFKKPFLCVWESSLKRCESRSPRPIQIRRSRAAAVDQSTAATARTSPPFLLTKMKECMHVYSYEYISSQSLSRERIDKAGFIYT